MAIRCPGASSILLMVGVMVVLSAAESAMAAPAAQREVGTAGGPAAGPALVGWLVGLALGTLLAGVALLRVRRRIGSERKYQKLMQTANAAMFILDAKTGVILEVNGQGEALLGVSADQIVGKHHKDFHPPGQDDAYWAMLREMVRVDRRISDTEIMTIRRGDGDVIPVEVTTSLTEVGGRKLAFCVCRDITERFGAEEERARLLENQQAILEHIQACVFLKDTQGRYIAVNRAYMDLLPPSVDDPVGKGPDEVFPPEVAEVFRREDALVLKEGLTLRKEDVVTRRDGRTAHMEVLFAPVRREDGQISGMVGIEFDITDRKQAEQELRRAREAAEAANKAKTEFLANVSHEIRTPINGIIGMTELALDTELTPDQQEYLEMVKASADALLGLINDILDFSKIEAGRLEMEPIEFDLHKCLSETLNPLGVRADSKGLEMVCRVRPNVPRAVVGDPHRLRQILVNLVGNAIRFTRTGEVAVEADLVEREGSRMCMHFTVRDTGIGIPPDKQEIIFEAFRQADGSTTRKYGGSGLGLPISAQLAEMMSGRVWVDSEVGKGSAFHFTAWFDQPANWPGEGACQSEAMPCLEEMDVLLVDENASTRTVLAEMLSQWGLRPVPASNGRTALDIFVRFRQAGKAFPLALIDASMAEMGGFELAERLSKQRPAPAMVMLMDASRRRDQVKRCREVGVASHIAKPIEQTALLEEIHKALGPDGIRPRPDRTSSQSDRQKGRPLRVLVAEDDVVSQKLVSKLLEKHKHKVVVVENGQEALRALEAEAFDLVLMDVQMPKMGGLEATRDIRRTERSAGGHVPVIAMTAHATDSDRQCCMDSGMDAYLGKPIRAKDFYDVIERVTSELAGKKPSNGEDSLGSEALSPAQRGETKPDGTAVDLAGALAHVDGDVDLLREIIELFLGDYENRLDEFRRLFDSGDTAGLAAAAHKFKGAVGNFAARAAWEAALNLEAAARRKDPAEIEEAVRLLAEETVALVGRLNELLENELARGIGAQPHPTESEAAGGG